VFIKIIDVKVNGNIKLGMPAFSPSFLLVNIISSVNAELVCYINGKPVTTSLGYISDDVMRIYNIATIPEYRRKGYGRMMILDLMLRGINEGIKASIL
jgi:ribosomal protein S18 acetylase RimI-like enzyme